MKLQVIGTGSSGNAYLLWDGGKALLLDAGVRIDKIQRALGWDMGKLVGCVITHEHGDHSSAVKGLSNLGVKCFGTKGTAEKVDGLITGGYEKDRIRKIGNFLVMDFDVVHDAAEPCGYLVTSAITGEKFLYATDTKVLPYKFPKVNYWLVECNHIKTLLSCDAVSRRVEQTHMALETLIKAFQENDMRECKKIILCHVSSERGDAVEMVRRVQPFTLFPVEVAQAGKEYELSLNPF